MAYDTKEEKLATAEIDPELAELLKKLDMPPMDYNDLAAFQKIAEERAEQTRALLGEPPSSIKRSEITYTTTDGTQNRAVLHQPTTPPSDGSPLIVLLHGGGFCIGSPDGEEQTARNLVLAFGATCFVPVYRLAPKFKFPTPIHDAWDALKFAAAHGQSWGADPAKGFIVGGTSAGGNMSACLAHIARDEGLTPPLTGQYLAIPAVCSNSAMPSKYADQYFSYEQNRHAPVLPVAAIDMFMAGYSPDETDHVWFNCLLHPKGHANLPPAYFQIDGLDPLRDEGLIYESELRKTYGVKTKLDMYDGVPHGHWGFFPMLKKSVQFREDQVEGVGWLLGRKAKIWKVDTEAKPATV